MLLLKVQGNKFDIKMNNKNIEVDSHTKLLKIKIKTKKLNDSPTGKENMPERHIYTIV